MDRNETETAAPMNTTQAAAYMTERGFVMSGKTVARLVDRGDLAARKTPGGHRLIKRSVIDRYIAALQ